MLDLKKLLTKILQEQKRNQLQVYDTTYSGTKTIGANGYVKLGNLPSNYTIMSLMVLSWSSSNGAFSLALASRNALYLVGQPNATVTDLAIRALYH